MKYFPALSTLFLVFFSITVYSQNTAHNAKHKITGTTIDNKTNNPVIYAHIVNRNSKLGTISNPSGEFSIPAKAGDTVIISYLGYKTDTLLVQEDKRHYEIRLQQNPQQLQTVTILPDDDDYLYEIIHKCRKNAPKTQLQAKGYFELKSYMDSQQVELIEGFYNLDIHGYDLYNIHLKTGRTALKIMRNQLFASLESSKAVLQIQTTATEYDFPLSPLQMTKSRMKRRYYLQLKDAYLNTRGDSVFEISFTPKKNNHSDYFEGTLWVNKTAYAPSKIKMIHQNTSKHPFIAIPKNDYITGAGFEITKNFEPTDSGHIFQRIDFDYFVDYNNYESDTSFRVTTSAVLFAYDYQNTFILPEFNITGTDLLTDYTKIASFPYNEFFWLNNNEPGLYDHTQANEKFISNIADLTSKAAKHKQSVSSSGLFENRFRPWSFARFIFENQKSQLQNRNFQNLDLQGSKYNLAVKIFFDSFEYPDSTQIITQTTFDLHESFYDLPPDNTALCFINMYFDLHEIARRRLQTELENAVKNNISLSKTYENFMTKLEFETRRFRESTNLGKNKEAMAKYNERIEEQLNLNNLSLFGLDIESTED